MENPEDVVPFEHFMMDNVIEVDFALAVFAAAAASYKHESLVKPFPPMYISPDGHKDIQSLREVVSSIPCLRRVTEGKVSLSSQQKELLNWVVHCYKTKICSVGLDRLKDLQRLTGEHLPLPTPQYLYELDYDEQRDSAFSEKCNGRSTIYAYHGSKAENFYSIINHGLHAHMNKTSLYGEGTYLAVEPTVAMGFSPWSITGWDNSTLGNNLSVVALCEVVDHPSVVHQSAEAGSNTGSRAPNSQGGDIPDKYMIVTNNDMVRVKYLLVYAKRSALKKCTQANKQLGTIQWIHNNSHAFLILFYLFLLLFIGLMGSTKFWTRVQYFYEQTFDNWGRTGSSSF